MQNEKLNLSISVPKLFFSLKIRAAGERKNLFAVKGNSLIMKIIRLKDGTQVSSAPSCAAAFGNFDGVHAGHRALLGEVVRISSESGGLLAPAVWTLRGFKFGDGKKLYILL